MYGITPLFEPMQGLLLTGPLETNSSEVWMKIHLEMSPAKWRPFCLGLNLLSPYIHVYTAHIPRQTFVNSQQWLLEHGNNVPIPADWIMHKPMMTYINHCGAGSGNFQEKGANALAVDALAPCVARSSAGMALAMWDTCPCFLRGRISGSRSN